MVNTEFEQHIKNLFDEMLVSNVVESNSTTFNEINTENPFNDTESFRKFYIIFNITTVDNVDDISD
jgi:hypothetical protein